MAIIDGKIIRVNCEIDHVKDTGRLSKSDELRLPGLRKSYRMGTITKQGRMLEQLRIRARDVIHTFLEVIYGMTLYDWVRELNKARNEQDRLFTLMIYGDLLGIPLLPPYYTLRLIPYLVPTLHSWRRSMLRERDLTDLIDQDIG